MSKSVYASSCGTLWTNALVKLAAQASPVSGRVPFTNYQINMAMSVQSRIAIIRDRFGQAFSACVIAMTQGDVGVITVGHFIKAGKVGMITATACVIASFVPRHTRWVGIWLTGVFTALADYLTHPSMMPGEFTECLVTGVGALVLALLWDRYQSRR
jgi:hypothetical protein